MTLTRVEGDFDNFATWAVMQLAHWHAELTGEKINIEVRSEPASPLFGYVVKGLNDSISIVYSEYLVHDLKLIINSLLCDETSLEFMEYKNIVPEDDPDISIYLGASDRDKETIRGLVISSLELGVASHLARARASDHFICDAAQKTVKLDRIKSAISRVACSMGFSFMLNHEYSHVVCGHIEYKRYLINSLKFGDDIDFVLGADCRFLEALADLNSHDQILKLGSSLRSEFKKLFNFDDALFSAGVASGFGVCVYILAFDNLNGDDQVHLSVSDRILLLINNAFTACQKAEKNEFKVEEALGLLRLFRLGQYSGLREAIRLWDKRGLPRHRDQILESFMESDLPCLICNDKSDILTARIEALANEFGELDRRMRSAGVELDSGLDIFSTAFRRPAIVQSHLLDMIDRVRQERSELGEDYF